MKRTQASRKKWTTGKQPTPHFHMEVNNLTTDGWRLAKRVNGTRRKAGGSIFKKDNAHKFVDYDGNTFDIEPDDSRLTGEI